MNVEKWALFFLGTAVGSFVCATIRTVMGS